eukprot:jgi/Tetstr1/422326/TSEL_013169.t1
MARTKHAHHQSQQQSQQQQQNGAGGEPSAKRAKTQAPSEKWRPGTVKKVIVENFMTYSKCTIIPGPRLNLVLGPNGTGKSSFVCALSMGLGGNPKLLGRADNVKDFVRRGQSEGSTEIWLARGEQQLVKIYRKIGINNKSEWKINKRPATPTEVKEIVSKYNIQLDNLCQFLPQDKVVEFARLKPDQLLVETERALGDAHLYDLHMELIKERKELKGSQDTMDSYARQLEKHRQANEGIERDVERFEKREQLLEQIDLRAKKKPWMEFREAKNVLGPLKEALKERQQQHKEVQERVAAVQKPLRDAQAAAAKAKQKRDVHRRELGTAEGKKKVMDDKIDAVGTDIDSVREQIKGLAEESKDRVRKIDAAERKVRECQAKFDALPSQQQDDSLEKALRQEIKELDTKQRDLDMEIDDLKGKTALPKGQLQQLKKNLSQVEDAKHQRVKLLEGQFPGIVKVWQWVQSNPNRFRGKVWGPLLSEVTVEDPLLANFLEMQVSSSLWSNFVTQFSEDQDLLVQQVKTLIGNNNLIISNYAGNPDEPLEHKSGTADDYAAHGVTLTLDQALKDTPTIVSHVLDDHAGISRAFVGSDSLKPNADKFLDANHKVTTLYFKDFRYTVTQSRYNAAARGKEISGIKQPRLLHASTSSAERDSLVRRIETIEETLASFHASISEKQALKSEITDQVTAKNAEAETELSKRKASPEPLAQEPKLQCKLSQHLDKLAALVLEYTALMRSTKDDMLKFTAAELASEEAAMVERHQKQQDTAVTDRLDNLAAEVQRAKDDFHNAKQHAQALRDKASREAPMPENEEEKEAHKAKMAELTDDIAELIQEMEELQAEADAIACSNPNVLKEYKERVEKIKNLEGKLEETTRIVNTGQSGIDEKKARWLPELQELVAKINTTFQINFSEIGFAGEVRLKEDDDFDKYEVQILVKFREEEELQVLTASRQSGGERSVCTILYLIALQGVTECPFRVVDEINQGMDPNNERKVFQQLVESACKPDTPQCFLLTPKLLPELPFNEDVRVLNIFNGPWAQDVAQEFALRDLLPSAPADEMEA